MKKVEKMAKDCPELVAELLSKFANCDVVANYYGACDQVSNCEECSGWLMGHLMEEVTEDVQCRAE